MKKLLSVILALSMCGSLMTFSATTASAATVETQAVSEVYVSPDLEAELDKMSANDTVAVLVTLATVSAFDDFDIEKFAKENGLEDQVEIDEDGYILDCTDKFVYALVDYNLSLTLKGVDEQYNKVKNNYCDSVLHYERKNGIMVCVSTKSQVEAMIDSGCVSSLELSDKEYVVEEIKLTWDEFYKMNDNVRVLYSQLKGVECTEDKYDVTFSDFFSETAVLVTVSEYEMNFTNPSIERMEDIVWMQSAIDSDMYIYENGSIYTAGVVYKEGKIDFETFKALGGMYFGDINGDDIVDVSDVTQLQLYLANNTNDPLMNLLTGFASAYYDVNFDASVDVSDVTTLQMYLAGYEV
ncbi:MAG: dockerin type I repeat-containing protein [Ruminococcus sp.]|nr:dockerin type I repeat-containing protein [Ruminococcus sp.]